MKNYTQQEAYEIFSRIDFGDIDGLSDPNLPNYFLDNQYWKKIAEGNVYYVIGRKGTGKSAIYNWVHAQAADKETIVSNLAFKTFPFEKLLQLSDDDFHKPNQYQSIWRNIILSEIAKMIYNDPRAVLDEEYKEICDYVEHTFGRNLIDLHKSITSQAVKTASGLQLYGISMETEHSHDFTYGDSTHNITLINSKLESCLSNYLKRHQTSRYIIQFDQLDDNYTTYLKEEDSYFQCIISLFKVIYDINQKFYRSYNIPIKVIGYLRSDIFNAISRYDAESSRWDDRLLHLNWVIKNRSDWNNPALRKLLDKRMLYAEPTLPKTPSPFAQIMEDVNMMIREKSISVFAYIIRRTFYRPRDVIQFCKKIQKEAQKCGKLNAQVIRDAEKEYSKWFLKEIENEIGPRIKDKETLFKYLRELSKYKYLDYQQACETYLEFEPKIKMPIDELLELLYNFGIIACYMVNAKRTKEHYSIFINENSSFHKNMNININKGLIKGLTAY